VNSTLACALVSAKLCIPVAHVEAGLRSFDRTMPEEINRLITDGLSDLLFTTEASAAVNLSREGIAPEKTHFVGNIMIDSIRLFAEPLLRPAEARQGTDRYAVLTLHRPSNVDNEESLRTIVSILEAIREQVRVIFPVHPRTKQSLERFSLIDKLTQGDRISMVDPMGYLEFMQLLTRATLVMTDSGGIQEETTYFGIPCLTLRENTERPATVEMGTNKLVGMERKKIEQSIRDILQGHWRRGAVPPFWDGHTAERVIDTLLLWKNQG